MKNRPIIAVCPKMRVMYPIYIFFIAIFASCIGVIALLNYRDLDTYWFINPSFPFWVFFLIWTFINMIYASPTFWVHEEGITVILPFRKIFVTWDEIVKVRSSSFVTDIFFRRLTFFNRIIGWFFVHPHPAIRFGNNRKNYKIFLKAVQENIPDKLR